ncbi:conserved hypothetical protein [Gammaproteobacteria bacterium]
MVEETSVFNIWSERDLGVDAATDQIFDVVSEADVEYCRNYFYPFIQLVNTNAVFDEELPLTFVKASTGWVIHDYGEAISTSAPYLAEQQKTASSILDQAKTIEEIGKLIATKGWISVEAIAGTQMMKRFVWIEAKRSKFDLVGYVPSASDEKCYDRLAKRAKDMGLIWEHPIKIKPPQSEITTAT